MNIAFRLLLILFIVTTHCWADDSVSSWYTTSTDKKVTINVALFLSSTCPHCKKADTFFKQAAETYPYLHIQRNMINEDKDALLRFNQLLNEQQMDDFIVPSIYFCGSRWVGFASAETTGKDLLHAIDYCKQQIEQKGALTSATIETLRHWANANKFDSGMVEHPSRLNYSITIAMIDAFSPCAFFCFSGFLAFLLLGESNRKRIFVSVLFIIAVAVVHYVQQAHANIFYEVFPWLRIPAVLTGLLTVYFVVQYYKKQANNLLYFLLAFLVGFLTLAYQQTCIMNWAYIFEQWLNNQHLSPVQTGLYQLIYQVLYVLPLLLTLALYLMLLKLNRFAIRQPQFTVIGLLFLSAIGLCLIVYPLFLSYLTLSVFMILFLIAVGYFVKWT